MDKRMIKKEREPERAQRHREQRANKEGRINLNPKAKLGDEEILKSLTN